MDEGPGAGSATDPEASWTRKGGRAHFGYKAHLGVDAASGLIRRAVLTPAHVNESEVADTLISGDERAVYADKAYESKARRARLRAQGINDRIMHRSHKHQRGLPYWQQRRNALIGKVRAPVEHVFGTLKRSYGYRTVRYLGWRGTRWSCGSNAWPTTCGARAACRRWPVANVGSVRRRGGGTPRDRPTIPRRPAVVAAAGRRWPPFGPDLTPSAVHAAVYAKVSSGRGLG